MTPGSASWFAVIAPANVMVGNSFTVTVDAYDAYNNLATGYNGTVHITSSPVSLPANYALTNGVGTFTVPNTLTSVGTETFTATDTSNSSITGNTVVTLTHQVTALMVIFSATATAGQWFPVTVEAVDSSSIVTSGYSGTVHFASSDGAADLGSGDVTLTNGVGVFDMTLYTAGLQTITATDTATSNVTGSATTTVVPGALAQFVVSAPSSIPFGTSFSFTVSAVDSYGNLETGYNGTVHFSSSDTSATLPGDAALARGVGTFSATFQTAGGQTLTAQDLASPKTGTAVVLVVGPPVAIVVTALSSSISAGGADFLVVSVVDSNGNVVTTYNGTVVFSDGDDESNAITAIQPVDFEGSLAISPTGPWSWVYGPNQPTLYFSPGFSLANGTGDFAVLLNGGTFSITATDSVTSSITGTSGAITSN